MHLVVQLSHNYLLRIDFAIKRAMLLRFANNGRRRLRLVQGEAKARLAESGIAAIRRADASANAHKLAFCLMRFDSLMQLPGVEVRVIFVDFQLHGRCQRGLQQFSQYAQEFRGSNDGKTLEPTLLMRMQEEPCYRLCKNFCLVLRGGLVRLVTTWLGRGPDAVPAF